MLPTERKGSVTVNSSESTTQKSNTSSLCSNIWKIMRIWGFEDLSNLFLAWILRHPKFKLLFNEVEKDTCFKLDADRLNVLLLQQCFDSGPRSPLPFLGTRVPWYIYYYDAGQIVLHRWTTVESIFPFLSGLLFLSLAKERANENK